MQFSPYRQPRYGQRMITEVVHNGNTVLPPIASVDWTTSIITFTTPHGLASGTHQIMVVPNDLVLNAPFTNVRAIPGEWIFRSNYTVLIPVAGDAYSAQLFQNGATTTPISVNLTSTDNNNNVDITKFHIEVLVPWEIRGFDPVKTLRMRTLGYHRQFAYRYMSMYAQRENGLEVSIPTYIALLGSAMPNNGNRVMSFGSYDIVFDMGIADGVIYVDGSSGFSEMRRTGYNGIVTDKGYETVNISKMNSYHTITDAVGITGIKPNQLGNQNFANGTVIQLFDLGGWNG